MNARLISYGDYCVQLVVSRARTNSVLALGISKWLNVAFDKDLRFCVVRIDFNAPEDVILRILIFT